MRPERPPVRATRGMVATSEPHAARAGLAMLQAGGNAVDAALAMAICLTVTEPTSNGIGGDAFALVWERGRLHGLNGSGRAPSRLTLDLLREAGHAHMPVRGWLPVTVPGAPRAWADLHARFGKLPFAGLFEPAIQHAREGYAVGEVVAHFWNLAAPRYLEGAAPALQAWGATFTRTGRAPAAGESLTLPDHARTLEAIAATGAEAFYTGELASSIVQFSDATGGLLTREDLAAHASEWVEPISTTYRDHQVWEIPPNGQGIATLLALNILSGFELSSDPDDPLTLHRAIEAMKLAFADALRYVADPALVDVPVTELLTSDYAARRRALIGERALDPAPGTPQRGGTVYLCAADADGLMVSYIQSNYMGFGSGIVVPGTGIALHNRGCNFSLDPDHPNALAPGKRPYHTIIPGFLTKNGEAIGPFGVMGGFMQPQGHLQVLLDTLHFGMDPQQTLDQPRWRWDQGLEVAVEEGFSESPVDSLRSRGHLVSREGGLAGFGRGQIIWRDGNGYLGGSERRADGMALGL